MYIQTDDNGNIVFWDNNPFLGGVAADVEIVIVGGRAYRHDSVPANVVADFKDSKRAEINAGFDAALTASLTMPSRSNPASAVELAVAVGLFNSDDPTGLADLCAIHEARRAALLAAVDGATTVDAVNAIVVAYAV